MRFGLPCRSALRAAIVTAFWAFACQSSPAADAVHRVASPSGATEVRLILTPGAGGAQALSWAADWRGQPILAPADLRLTFAGSGKFGNAVEVIDATEGTIDETYPLIVGKADEARNHCRELTVALRDAGEGGRRVNVVLRAYDDGVALRYEFPAEGALSDFELTDEQTEFRFGDDPLCVALPLKNYATSYEALYHTKRLSSLAPAQLYGVPLLLQLADDRWAAVTEANLTDYAGMYVQRSEGDKALLVSRLSPRLDRPEVKVVGKPGSRSPWRVVMLGADPGDLIESHLVTNLNEPSKIEHPAWLRPGKVNFPWWNGYVVEGRDFRGGVNTETIKYCIDFCAEHGIEYASLDGFDVAWYGGPIRPNGPVDVTTAIPEIDLDEVLRYSRDKEVPLRAWVHWLALEPQLDEALAAYEEWGLEGIMVDFMDRDDQQMVQLYHRMVETAARRHLSVNFHGAYKPTGLRRTWPNLFTREGVLNLEYDKWAQCPPEHNVTVPFTRMLAGPLDYHTGGFRNVRIADFKSQRINPLVVGTRCHSLAMYVVYENPLPMVADHPAAYQRGTGVEFLADVPTVWDETRFLEGEVGKYICLARRNGDVWYVGGMCGPESRDVEIELEFLGKGQYAAELYEDDPNGAATDVRTSRRQFERDDVLPMSMSEAGGFVARMAPSDAGVDQAK